MRCVGVCGGVILQATRDAILNRSHEHTEARLHTFHNTTAVYDLLTIALVKRAQYNMLSEVGHRFYSYSQLDVFSLLAYFSTRDLTLFFTPCLLKTAGEPSMTLWKVEMEVSYTRVISL